MKVFISWSGTTSREIGDAFRGWLPDVLQFVQPYFTPNDIDKGQRWASEIADNLETSKVGLICLTAENLEAPWLMFEAGAISKSIGSRLCPILFGVETSQLKGPLIQFQATPYSKEEVFKFIETINSAGDSQALTLAQLERAFERCWPELDEKIQLALGRPTATVIPAPRPVADMIEEMLGIVRALPHSAEPLPEQAHWALLFTLVNEYMRDILVLSHEHARVGDYHQLERAIVFMKAALNLASPRLVSAKSWSSMYASSNDLLKSLQKRATELNDDIPF